MSKRLGGGGSGHRYIIVTDLDGTLLDDTYSYGPLAPLIGRLRRMGIPVIFCSSKTRLEQEYYRRLLGIRDPFIVENGAAIYLPEEAGPWGEGLKRRNGYYVLELGIPVDKLKEALAPVMDRLRNYVEWVHEMTPEKIVKLTGLPPEQVPLMLSREYSLALRPLKNPEAVRRLIESVGLRCLMGSRLCLVCGQHDKGVAVRRLRELYEARMENPVLVGIGDSTNDIEMLRTVDIPVLLGGSQELRRAVGREDLVAIEEKGPKGWAQAIKLIIKIP